MRRFALFIIFIVHITCLRAQDIYCDSAVAKHVFSPSRLTMVEPCVTVKGVVKFLLPGRDGDMHIALKPDSGYSRLINASNIAVWDSCLVCEIVCQHAPDSTAGVGDICKGYVNHVQVPRAGSHIAVTGTLAEDDGEGILGKYGWMEIHPVTAIASLKPVQRQPGR